MSATEWTALTVAAIGALGVALGNVVLQALQMWLTYKRDLSLKEGTAKVEQKVDANTKITKEGTAAAATNARAAVSAATTAAAKTEEIAEQLNGKLESKITEIVKAHTEPIVASLNELKRHMGK